MEQARKFVAGWAGTENDFQVGEDGWVPGQSGTNSELVNLLAELLGQPPAALLDRWMDNELADYGVVLKHCSEVYDYLSGGRISKPNTLPSEVIALAERLEHERDNERLGEYAVTFGRTLRGLVRATAALGPSAAVDGDLLVASRALRMVVRARKRALATLRGK
jgi:hypothetical protein